MIPASFFWTKAFNIIPVALSEVAPQFPPNAHTIGAGVNGTNVLTGKFSTVLSTEILHRVRINSVSDIILLLLILLALLKADRIVAYLERAELRAANHGETWEAEDLRVAQLVVTLADEGCADPYTQAFVKLYSKHPSKVVTWWRDQEKLATIAAYCNSALPLMCANRAEEALSYREPIPDYDPLADHRGALPPTKPALPATTSLRDGGSAGLKETA